MNLSYSKETVEKYDFKMKILDGRKKHSLRLDPHDRWKVGMKINHCTGLRTPQYDCFKLDRVESIQSLLLNIKDNGNGCFTVIFVVDNRKLEPKRIYEFCENDGFDNAGDFCRYFLKDKERVALKLRIIHWTNLKY
jgi:hypothetical protein